MNLLRRAALLGLGALLLAPVGAVAQPAGSPRNTAESPLAQEVLAFRERLRAAVTAKNKQALDVAFDENFNHLRDSGRVDLKGERIALLLSGESTIETAPEENMVVQVYEPATAAVIGVSPITDRQTGKTARFRWLTVYVKQAEGWRVALSQASRAQGRASPKIVR
jgi:hypothetical protein